jgi:hypothetical protein
MASTSKYANIVGTIALLFSLSGGALAATRYLVNSTKQISPNVLKALKGTRGPQGPQGPTGTSGSPGTPGASGRRAQQAPQVAPWRSHTSTRTAP